MRNPRLAHVYAKSLLDFAKESNQVDNAFQDMQYVKEVCKVSPEFDRLLSSPVIKDDKKAAIVGAVLKDKVSAASWAFITLVINKNRAEYLSQIAEAVIEQYEVINGIHEVLLTTAVTVDKSTQKMIVDKLKEATGYQKVKLNAQVDSDIIGGFILEFDNKLIDDSIARKLNDLKLRMVDQSFTATI